jgi:phosphate/sulfate permease
MKSLFKWFFRIALFFVILAVVAVVALLLLKDVLAKSAAEKNLRDSTGMDAKIAKFDSGLFTSTVDLEGIKLYNKPEFGGGTFLEMPELRVEVVPEDLRKGKIHLKTVRINISQVTVVKDANGKLNTDDITKEAKKKSGGEKSKSDIPGVDFGGIDTLIVSIGKVKFKDLGNPRFDQEFRLNLKEEKGQNLKTEAEVQAWFQMAVLKVAMQEAMRSGNADGGQAIGQLFQFFQPTKRKKNR